FLAAADDKAQEGANLAHLTRPNRRTSWQRQHVLDHVFGDRQRPAPRQRIRAVRLHSMTAWIEVAPREDVLRGAQRRDVVTREVTIDRVEFNDDVLEIVPRAVVVLQ